MISLGILVCEGAEEGFIGGHLNAPMSEIEQHEIIDISVVLLI